MVGGPTSFRLQKEVETLRLASLNQQTETQRLLGSLSASQRETKELQEELERRDSIIKAKVILALESIP